MYNTYSIGDQERWEKTIEMGSKEDHTQPETRRFVDLHPYAHAIEDPRLMQGFTHPPGQLNHSWTLWAVPRTSFLNAFSLFLFLNGYLSAWRSLHPKALVFRCEMIGGTSRLKRNFQLGRGRGEGAWENSILHLDSLSLSLRYSASHA